MVIISVTTAMATFNSIFVPTFKCETDQNNHQYVDTNVGLIKLDEAIYAGSYYYDGTSSTNTYLNVGKLYWTMTPAGVYQTSTATE